MMRLEEQKIVIIRDINNKDEILEELRFLYTDEDFSGNNGKEFTWEEALENGFVSSQDYVIDQLKKSDLKGVDLVKKFFEDWLDSDGYYTDWNLEVTDVNGTTVISVAIVIGD